MAIRVAAKGSQGNEEVADTSEMKGLDGKPNSAWSAEQGTERQKLAA